MKAGDFEVHHQIQLHLFVAGLAAGAYVVDPDDVVWAMLHWHTPQQRLLARVIFLAAALLVGVGAGLRTWGRAWLEGATEREYQLDGERWSANGPYRHVRHPLELGGFLAALGMSSLLSRTGLMVLLGGTAIRILRLVGRDEDERRRRYGAAFDSLCRRVSRFAPSPAPRIPAGARRARWRQAFRTETITWGFFVTLLVFAITLRDALAWIFAGMTLVAQLALNSLRKKTVAVEK